MGYAQNCLGVYFEEINAHISLRIYTIAVLKNYFHAGIQELNLVFAHLIKKLVQIIRVKIYLLYLCKNKIIMRISVVEDDQLIRLLMVFKLSGMGHDVEQFINGAKALEFYNDNRLPDLIITDIMMPIMGGIEFASKIREIDKKIPLVAVTGGTSNIGVESKSMFTLWVEKNGSIDHILAIIFQGLTEKKLMKI